MDQQKFENILQKYKEGTCTEEEQELVYRWANEYAEMTGRPDIQQDELNRSRSRMWLKIYRKVRPQSSSNLWYRISAAAAVFAAGVLLFHFYQRPERIQSVVPTVWASEIRPGGNHAFLTLANGKRVSLDNMRPGDRIAGTQALKSTEGTVRFDQPDGTANPDELTTITTPKGGQFHIVLSDGTKVWLNAASFIIIPVSFTSTGRRFVRLTGEAYFQVAKDRNRPFIVETATQQVKVLGTHFNVNAYTDEQDCSTTLLEGSVQLISTSANSKLTLIPGQQAHFQNNQFKVRPANDDVIAWKDGRIKFNGTPLPEIMRQLSRWYNVEVVYEGASRDRAFTGVINRTYNLKTVLEILNGMGIESRLENRLGKPFLVVKN
ncbi:FecR family protein [Chitinophaga barathri]|uniref:DUF4974 domain-containing protein n=1 Tax=Chitinophaga barathri TaxID=1647451 RepID=A0A3N4M7H1_9BACT|nr:FecR family protein [Chitinophaga barathri]RPD39321.1 DUF4974 domain-containing protein [Chitinophaga barathri]